MVRLSVKKGNDSLFIHDTTVKQNVAELATDILAVYGLRLKVLRLCDGMYFNIKNYWQPFKHKSLILILSVITDCRFPESCCDIASFIKRTLVTII